jgi:plasmid stability protein
LTERRITAYNAIIDCTMPSLTIRRLDHQTKERLRVRAAQHRRSMESEARHILREAMQREPGPPANLATAIRRRFRPLGGVELVVPAREPMRRPPRLPRLARR